MLRRNLQRRAFTLIEIIVVATLISLLSGIALFSINEMYIRNIRKVSIAEAFQLATALSIAENDLNFYPNFAYLRQAKELVLVDPNTPGLVTESTFNSSLSPSASVPGIDYWGFLRFDNPLLLRIVQNWNGPYMGVSQARQAANRGAQSGLVKMRLPHLAEEPVTIDGADISLVDWPADPFGNPYMLYQLKAEIDSGTGVNIPLFLNDPGEEADWRNMIVSYGRNNYPGGNENTARTFGENTLIPGALFIEGDPYSSGPDDTADFTLKVIDRRQTGIGPARSVAQIAADATLYDAIALTDPNLLLANDPAAVAAFDTDSQHYLVLRSLTLSGMDPGNFDLDLGQVGIIDDGSDDIILEF